MQAAALVDCAAGVAVLYAESLDCDDSAEDLDPAIVEAAESVTKVRLFLLLRDEFLLDFFSQLINSLTDSICRRGRPIGVYGHRAIDRLHECETDLDDARMTALRDLFTLDENCAATYTVLKRESLRKAWIQVRLKEMGFPGMDECE